MDPRRLTVVVPLLVVTGCGVADLTDGTPSSIAVDTFSTAESTLRPPPQDGVNAVLDARGAPALLTFTVWGSSGCVRVPVSVAWSVADTVEVGTAPSRSTECSAVYEPVSQVVELPAGHGVDEVSTVEIDGEPVPFTVEEGRGRT